MLEFNGVNLAFKDKVLINDGCLKLFPSKIACLSGKSGSGKTTLLNDLFKRLKDNQVLYISQYDNFFVDMTCKDNLYYISKLYGVTINDRLIKEAMDEVGLDVLLSSYPNTLSGGEKQRLLLVMALLIKAEVILMDEITASMDQDGRVQFIALLKEFVSKYQCMVLISSHDDYVMENCDIHYHIDNKQIVCLKGLDDQPKTKLHVRSKVKPHSFLYFKNTLKKHLPLTLFTVVVQGLLLACFVLGCVFFIQINKETNKLLNNNPGNQMLVHYHNMYDDHEPFLKEEDISSLYQLADVEVYPFMLFEQTTHPSNKAKRHHMYEMKWLIDNKEYSYSQDSSEDSRYFPPRFYPYYENQHLEKLSVQTFETTNRSDTIPCYILEDYLPSLNFSLDGAKNIIIETKIQVPYDACAGEGVQIRDSIKQQVDTLQLEYETVSVKLEVLGIVPHYSGNYGGSAEIYLPYAYMKEQLERYPSSPFLKDGKLYYASGYMLFSDDMKQTRSLLNQYVPNVRNSHSRDSLSDRLTTIQKQYTDTISKLLMMSGIGAIIAFGLFSILNERSFKQNRALLKIRGLKKKQMFSIHLLNALMEAIFVFVVGVGGYLYGYQVLEKANYMVSMNDYILLSVLLLIGGSIIFTIMSRFYSLFKCIK